MSKFTITAQLKLQAPTNINAVVTQIKNGLKGINANVNVKVNNQALTQLKSVQKSLQNTGKNAKQAADSMAAFGKEAGFAIRRFGALTAATTAFRRLSSAISSSTKEAIDFERELFRIAQVSRSSVSSLSNLSNEVTRLAKEFGVNSNELLKTARILKQTGLSADETRKSLEALAKSDLAPTFDDINKTAEGAIAIFRQFNKEAKDLEGILGSINAVSKNFAVESSDLITAVRRTGGAFSAAGGELNELLGLFTSVRATTRESAESIATGFRTIFTRLQRTRTINFLGNLGVDLRTLEGQFVGPFEAVKRLSQALKDLPATDPRFAQIVEELGGFRQISKVIPLIQQFATAQDALTTAQAGSGSIAEDAAKAQGALAVQFQKVREEFQALIRNITRSEGFQSLTRIVLGLASALTRLADSLTPIIGTLTALATPVIGAGFLRFLNGVQGSGGFFKGLTGKNQGGIIKGFNSGGVVPGVGNRDTVPAMLTPGEFVIRKSSVEKYGADNLNQLNSGGVVHRMAGGRIPGFKPQSRGLAPGNVGRKKQTLQAELAFLRGKQRAGTLTPDEQARLLSLEARIQNVQSRRTTRFSAFLADSDAVEASIVSAERSRARFAERRRRRGFAFGGDVQRFQDGNEVRRRLNRRDSSLEVNTPTDLRSQPDLNQNAFVRLPEVNLIVADALGKKKLPTPTASKIGDELDDTTRRIIAAELFGDENAAIFGRKQTSAKETIRDPSSLAFGVQVERFNALGIANEANEALNEGIRGSIVGIAEGAVNNLNGMLSGFSFNGNFDTNKFDSVSTKLESDIRGLMFEGFIQGVGVGNRADKESGLIDFPTGFNDFDPNSTSAASILFGANAKDFIGKPVEAKATATADNLAETVAKFLKAGVAGQAGVIPPSYSGPNDSNVRLRQNLNSGGGINGISPQDTVPALLTPGEFVFNKEAAQRIGRPTLERLNKGKGFNTGGRVRGYNKGGFVSKFNSGGFVDSVGGVAGVAILGSIIADLANQFASGNEQFSKLVQTITSVGTQFILFKTILGQLNQTNLGSRSIGGQRLQLEEDIARNTQRRDSQISAGVKLRQARDRFASGITGSPNAAQRRGLAGFSNRILRADRERSRASTAINDIKAQQEALNKSSQALNKWTSILGAASLAVGSFVEQLGRSSLEGGDTSIGTQAAIVGGSALSSAGSGALLGSAFGLPGILAGALGGAAVGAGKALFSLQDDIEKVEFGKLSKDIELTFKRLSEGENASSLTGRVEEGLQGLLDRFNTATTTEELQELTGAVSQNAAQFKSFLTDIAKNSPTVDAFNTSVGDSVKLFASLNKIDVNKLNKEFSDLITETVRLRDETRELSTAEDRFKQVINSSIGIASAFQDASTRVRQFTSGIGDIFGDLSDIPDPSELISRGSTIIDQDLFNNAVQSIRNTGIAPANDLVRSVVDGQDVLRQLPSILTNLRAEDPLGAGQDLRGRFAEAIGDITGDGSVVQRLLSARLQKFIGAEGKEEKALEAISSDLVGIVENLSGGLDGLTDSVGVISGVLNQQANELAGLLNRRSELEKKIVDQRLKEIDNRQAGFEAQAGFGGRNLTASDFQTLRGFDTERALAIQGRAVQAPGVLDPATLGRELETATNNLSATSQKIQQLGQASDSLIEKRQEEANRVDALTQTLEFLADGAARAAVPLRELSVIEGRRNTVSGISSSFAFGDFNAREGIGQSVESLIAVLNGIGLEQLSGADRSAVGSLLGRLGDLPLFDNAGNALGGADEVARNLVSQSFQANNVPKKIADEIAGVLATPEEVKLRKEVENVFRIAGEAQNELIKESNNKLGILNQAIVNLPKDFANELNKIISRQQREQTDREISRVTSELSDNESRLETFAELRDATRDRTGGATTIQGVRERLNFLNEIEETRKRDSSLRGARNALQADAIVPSSLFDGPERFVSFFQNFDFDRLKNLASNPNLSAEQQSRVQREVLSLEPQFARIENSIAKEGTSAFSGADAVSNKTALNRIVIQLRELDEDIFKELSETSATQLETIRKRASDRSVNVRSGEDLEELNKKFEGAFGSFSGTVVSLQKNIENLTSDLGKLNLTLTSITIDDASFSPRPTGTGTVLRNRGGFIPGAGNRDTVPAMLTPGEFVLRKEAARSLDPAMLEEFNRNGFRSGGRVSGRERRRLAREAIRARQQAASSSRRARSRERVGEVFGGTVGPLGNITALRRAQSIKEQREARGRSERAARRRFQENERNQSVTSDPNLGRVQFSPQLRLYQIGAVSGIDRIRASLPGSGAAEISATETFLEQRRRAALQRQRERAAILGARIKEINDLGPNKFDINGRLIPRRRRRLPGAGQFVAPTGFNRGGFVPGFGTGDIVPAMLEPGEFVLNKNTANQIGVNNLEKINNKGRKGFQNGGAVQGAGGLVNISPESINALNQTITTFSGSANQLSQSLDNFPREVQHTFNGTLEVVLNGADVLSRMMPEIQEMVLSETKSAMNKMIGDKFPDVGPVD